MLLHFKEGRTHVGRDDATVKQDIGDNSVNSILHRGESIPSYVNL